jgi:uncharacterized protein
LIPLPIQQIGKFYPGGKMVTNILEIRKILEDNKENNQVFANFLNKFSATRTFAMVQLLHNLAIKYSELIDCTKCGNCCTRIIIQLFGEDRRRLAKMLSMTEKEFMDIYMKKTDNGWIYVDKQCPFQENKKCLVYNERPGVCRDFPFLDLDKMCMDGKTMIKAEEIIGLANRCAIVFNVFEEMKVRSGFAKDTDTAGKKNTAPETLKDLNNKKVDHQEEIQIQMAPIEGR